VVLMVLTKMDGFCDVALCRLMHIYQGFGGAWRLHLHGQAVPVADRLTS
jgi:hypothetical protein